MRLAYVAKVITGSSYASPQPAPSKCFNNCRAAVQQVVPHLISSPPRTRNLASEIESIAPPMICNYAVLLIVALDLSELSLSVL